MIKVLEINKNIKHKVIELLSVVKGAKILVIDNEYLTFKYENKETKNLIEDIIYLMLQEDKMFNEIKELDKMVKEIEEGRENNPMLNDDDSIFYCLGYKSNQFMEDFQKQFYEVLKTIERSR